MKIVLFGASGYLGSHAAQQLLKAGHDVTCIVRDSSDLRFLQQLQAKIIAIDFADEQHWQQLIDTNTTVINCIADTRSHASYAQRKIVEIDLTSDLFKRAQQYQAKRFIQLSTVMVYGFDRPATAIAENHPCSATYIYNHMAADREAALQALYQANKTTELLILRPSNTLGKRDSAFLPAFLQAHSFGLFPTVAGGQWAFSCIDARDVGRALEHLVNVKVDSSNTYLVKGFDTDWLSFKSALDDYLGKRSRVLNLPKKLMLPIATLLEHLVPFGINPGLTRFDLQVLSTDTLFDDSKIRATGFIPHYSLEHSFNDAIAADKKERGE